MKLLLFSDLHCDAIAAGRLVEQASVVDVVIGAGDFATVRRGIRRTLDVLQAISRPTVLVPGNSETLEELEQACRGWQSAQVVHGRGVAIDGVWFYGLGGAVPKTPFGPWSYDLSEDEARTLLADCPDSSVLISHSPPKGVVDQNSSGRSLGSQAVRDAVEARKLSLVVCGHIHESGGQTGYIGTTPVVNAGPRGIVWDL
jgi:Icc-related predicted phosphoesterase